MLFRIISAVLILGLAGWLSRRRFQKSPAFSQARAGLPSVKVYIAWVIRRVAPLTADLGRPAYKLASRRLHDLYPGAATRWAAVGLAVSFAYLAASGLGFALFTTRGMFGAPLVLHVMVGGLFAACLTAFVVIRAKNNVTAPESFVFDRFALRRLPTTLPAGLVRPVLFWIFVVSGLILTAAALGSMLRFFSFDTQTELIAVHRYSALVSVLAVIGLFDSVFLAGD